MISKVKSKYWRSTHKFGIEIPKSLAEAYRIDKETVKIAGLEPSRKR